MIGNQEEEGLPPLLVGSCSKVRGCTRRLPQLSFSFSFIPFLCVVMLFWGAMVAGSCGEIRRVLGRFRGSRVCFWEVLVKTRSLCAALFVF